MIDLRQLKYFVALAELQNFSRVAEREHVTQSAVSQQIGRLERAVGLRLFARTTHITTLTSDGAALLPYARSVLIELSGLERHAETLARGLVGALRLGSPINSAKSTRRQRLLAAFSRAHPDIDLTIDNGWSTHLISALRAQEIDLAFINLSLPRPHPDVLPPGTRDLDFQLVQDEPSALIVPSHLELADLTDENALFNVPVLMYPRELNPWHYDQQLAVVERLGARIVRLREPSLPGILEEVRRGRGVFPAIPWEVTGLHAQGLDGVRVKFPTSSPFRSNLWLVRRRDDERPTTRLLFNLIDAL